MRQVWFYLAMTVALMAVFSCGSGKKDADGPLPTLDCPQFVLLGSDDNGVSGLPGSSYKGGIAFFLDLLGSRRNPVGRNNPATHDGTPLRMTFFMITSQLEAEQTEKPALLADAWRAIYEVGHEIALHTHSHPHGHELTVETWMDEMKRCRDLLTTPRSKGGIGIPPGELVGFRTPYLEYNPAAFTAMERLGLRYDCSIEEGLQPHEDGRNFPWPYPLAQGSPGDAYTARGHRRGTVGSHPSLWEIPVYTFIVPPDDTCRDYGLEPGLRDRLAKRVDYFDPRDGKITGFDWNLWVEFAMTREEFLATLKYSFDLRLQGNRCPFHLGLHSDIYSDGYEPLPASTPTERQAAIRELLDHMLGRPEVRVVTFRDLVNWLKAPQGLGVKP
jgi:peptidoglycan/xylan/chitin deacetylase (PgdA/CDA1 family)